MVKFTTALNSVNCKFVLDCIFHKLPGVHEYSGYLDGVLESEVVVALLEGQVLNLLSSEEVIR
jgi:hypothetical protein